jgi:5-methylcytosine-specific restriction endonuclease McrA
MPMPWVPPDAPCKHGHVGRRSPTTKRCLACVEADNARRRSSEEQRLRECEYASRRRNGPNRDRIKAAALAGVNRKYAEDAAFRERRKAAARALKSQKRLSPAFKEAESRARKAYRSRPEVSAVKAAYDRRWRRKNRDKLTAKQRRRSAALAQQCPRWLTHAQSVEILSFYSEARKLTEETGVRHEVDHIVPLNGRGVRGLHVPWNLQILTRRENASKGNRFWPADDSQLKPSSRRTTA